MDEKKGLCFVVFLLSTWRKKNEVNKRKLFRDQFPGGFHLKHISSTLPESLLITEIFGDLSSLRM